VEQLLPQFAKVLSAWRRVPIRGSLRGMTISSNPYRGFRFPPEVIDNHFQLRRHHLNANQYRTARNAAFCAWHDIAEVAPAV
jgi:hypothetical protein